LDGTADNGGGVGQKDRYKLIAIMVVMLPNANGCGFVVGCVPFFSSFCGVVKYPVFIAQRWKKLQ
jgi:hypothetical protein